MYLTGAEVVMESLVREGVEVIFGYPGGANMPIYDAMMNYPIKHVLTRHEQGAAFAADGYARASGKVGVAMATSGPGATNLVTGITTAMMDSSPVVYITGQVASSLIGGDAFQETDVTGITLPITKHNYLVTSAAQLAETIREAFYIARSGRPGPVLIDICKDTQFEKVWFEYSEEEVVLPGYKPPLHATKQSLDAAVKLIQNAKRPVILAGHGVLMSGAMGELAEFAEKTQTPVALTLLGLGAFPAGHPYHLGMMGMHGTAHANFAIQNADLILAFGMRFDDRVTGTLHTYAARARKIHVDIDSSEFNKNVKVDLTLLGDLQTVLADLNPIVPKLQHPEWLEQIQAWKQESAQRDILYWEQNGKLHAAHVIHDFWKQSLGEKIVTTGVGQHQMWTAQYYVQEKPYRLITSGGAGSMGFGTPSALGAWFANPDKEVWTIEGDGSFQMSLNELATLKQENANVKILLINNGFLGMVRQWQEFFFDKRYAATPITGPDFVKLAQAYDVPSIAVNQRDQINGALEMAQRTYGPVLIEFQVEPEDCVYPMVPSGAALDEMLLRPIKVNA
ncbi:MAG: acetolactate synthase, large subunit, biosynthetic type [Chloroflexi bacterium HGW-Chloroflexi-3]|nr:MAG: acetolactate synthase, large subunit, biosynthetic type [Chloroflexi bacterium HGW-Chloroflexi-3]